MIKNENGKRERGNLEEDTEFMPLSKRINNIHLTQSQLNNGVPQMNGHAQSSSTQLQSESSQNGQTHISQDLGHQDTQSGHVNGHSHYNGKIEHTAVQVYPSNFDISANNHHHSQSHHNSSASSGPSNCQPSLHNGNQGQNYMQQSISSSLNSTGVSIPIANANYLEEFRYEPVLNESSNPHYYEQNRQLFLLYMERIQRYNLPPHPHFYTGTNTLDPRDEQQHNHNL